jgi:hypothetical protein
VPMVSRTSLRQGYTGTPSYRSYSQDTHVAYDPARLGYKPRFFNVTLTPPPC